MIEVKGNLWDYPADYRVITTNGTVKKNGACVMGRGCAAEASKRYPKLPFDLGELIKTGGNRLWAFPEYCLISFPVKHNWWEKADPDLIVTSANSLLGCCDVDIVMPRPGCGNGGLKWEDVKPLISFLPDRIHVITW